MPAIEEKASRKLRMLIVEDDKFFRQVVQDWFGDEKYEFVEAEDGIQAIGKTFDYHPDIIITDLILPRASGADYIKTLRKSIRYATTPIVAITGGSKEMQEQARQAGAHMVLAKPLEQKQVVTLVENLISATPFIRK